MIEHNVRKKFLEVIQKHSKVDYISTTDEYVYDNVVLGISTLDDNKFIPFKDLQSSSRRDITIALGHYMLKNSCPSKTYDREIEDYVGYDLALLGDIHSRKKMGNCIYSGSLVQQNYGENNEKGYGIINIAKRKYSFVDVSNDYSFYTISVDEALGSLELPDISTFKPHSRIRIRSNIIYKNKEESYMAQLKKHLGEQLESVKFQWYDGQSASGLAKDPEGDSDSQNDEQTPVNDSILMECIQEQYNDDTAGQLLSLHKKYIQDDTDITINPVKWTIKSLTLNNIFQFKGEHKLNFDKLKGLIGIKGANTHGKSNIINALVFALCGKITIDLDTNKKFYKYEVKNILNDESSKGSTTVIIQYGDKEYKIHRQLPCGTKLFENGTQKGDSKLATDKAIEALIGNSTEFLLKNIINIFNVSLRTTSKEERLTILSKVFNIGERYDTVLRQVNDDYKKSRDSFKELTAKISGHMEYNKLDKVIDDIETSEEEISRLQSKIKKLNKARGTTSTETEPSNMGDDRSKDYNDDVLIKRTKASQQAVLKYSTMIRKDIPETSNKSTLDISNITAKVLDEYDLLKNSKKINIDTSSVNTGAGVIACKTGVMKKEVDDLEKRIDTYDYSETIDRDELLAILAKFSKSKMYVDPTVKKYSKFHTQLEKIEDITVTKPYNITLKKENVQNFIDTYKSIDQEKLKQEIDAIEIPPLKPVKDKKVLKDDIETLDKKIQTTMSKIVDFMKIDELLELLKTKGITEETLSSVNRLKGVDEVITRVSSDVSDLNKRKIKLEKDIEYNKLIDEDIKHNSSVHSLKTKKTRLKKELQDAIQAESDHAMYLKTMEEIKHNELLESLGPFFREINRRVSYLDTKFKYNRINKEYQQHLQWVSEENEKYERLQEILPYVNYYNNKHIKSVADNDNSVAIYNGIIELRVTKYQEKIKELENSIEQTKLQNRINSLKDKSEVMEKQMNLLKQYKNLLVGEGGLRVKVLEYHLKYLARDINEILMNRVNFTVELNPIMAMPRADKSDPGQKERKLQGIDLSIHYGEKVRCPLQLSGQERLIFDLATKVVLNHYDQYSSKSNILIMDEGTDVLDNENVEVLKDLFETIKIKYKQIFVISHNEAIQHLATDGRILIEKGTIK